MRIAVVGAGVAGLVAAVELMRAGHEIDIYERADTVDGGASWLAGGMLAPWCEAESADEEVTRLGRRAPDWWEAALPRHIRPLARKGTLVVAQPRDQGELTRFARRSSAHRWLEADEIGALEPDLEGRFQKALFFEDEAHLDPRAALLGLEEVLRAGGVQFHFGRPFTPDMSANAQVTIDCRGISARADISKQYKKDELRGVRGEMLLLQTDEITLSRPVRMLHPRIPLYIAPRSQGRFMVGATMLESDSCAPPTVRSITELLNAAYALHPSFAQAHVIETAAGVRPAFPDNLPRIIVSREPWPHGPRVHFNGLYRHGFLLSPAYGQTLAENLASHLNNNEHSQEIAP